MAREDPILKEATRNGNGRATACNARGAAACKAAEARGEEGVETGTEAGAMAGGTASV